ALPGAVPAVAQRALLSAPLLRPRHAESADSSARVGLAAKLSACSLLAAASVARPARRRSALRRHASSSSQSSIVANENAEVDSDFEDAARQLRLEAAQLRADVEELEQTQKSTMFRSFDADGSGAVDASELQEGMKEFRDERLDEATALRLLQVHDSNNDGVLQPEEFDIKRLQSTLEVFRKEKQAEEDVKEKEAGKRREAEKEQKALDEFLETLPPANEDTGVLSRLASILAYCLPVWDSLRFSVPLVSLFPALGNVTAALLLPLNMLRVIPFVQLFLFLGMQFLAANNKLPRLVRFNMRQAIMIDIGISLISVLEGTIAFLFKLDHLPGFMTYANSELSIAIFAVSSMLISYCTVSNLCGIVPNGLPWISANAEKTMAKTRREAEIQYLEAKAMQKEKEKKDSTSSS
ncbi:unnamed protein product, partial [Polarella glacialis]